MAEPTHFHVAADLQGYTHVLDFRHPLLFILQLALEDLCEEG